MKLMKRQIEISNRSLVGRFGHNVDYHSGKTAALLGLPFFLFGLSFLFNVPLLELAATLSMGVSTALMLNRCDCAGPVVFVSLTTKKTRREISLYGTFPVILMVLISLLIGPALPIFLTGVWFFYLALSGRSRILSSAEDYARIRAASARNCSMEELQEVVELAVELGDFSQAEKISKLLVEKAENT